MVLYGLDYLTELVLKPLHCNCRSLRLLSGRIDSPSCNEAERIPDLVVEVSTLLYLRLIIEDIVSCRAAEEHTETHSICTVLLDQIERVR